MTKTTTGKALITVTTVTAAEVAKDLGITEAEVLANWAADEAEQRALQTRFRKLQRMALERGCRLWEGPLEYDDDEEEHEGDDYLLFVSDYPEPIEFDDLDEVEFDILSRPVVTRRRAVKTR